MRAAVAALLITATGCVVEPIDLNDRKCDEEHACVNGYECIDGECELEGASSSD